MSPLAGRAFREGSAMNRPKPLVPEDLAKRAARPSVYLCRAATASLRSFVSDGATPINIARDLWGDDSVTNLVLRAATAPARTDTANWAQQLATTSIIDFVQSITSRSRQELLRYWKWQAL
jgi:hypothetical protein